MDTTAAVMRTKAIALVTGGILLALGVLALYLAWMLNLRPIANRLFGQKPTCPPRVETICPETPADWLLVTSEAGFELGYPPEWEVSRLDDPYPGKIRFSGPEGNLLVEVRRSNMKRPESGFEEVVCAHIETRRGHVKTIEKLVPHRDGIFATWLPAFQLPAFPEGMRFFPPDPYYQEAYFQSGGDVITVRAQVYISPHITPEVFKRVICSFTGS